MEITLPPLFMLEARRYQEIAHATKWLNLERVSYTNPTVDTRGEPLSTTFNFKRVSLRWLSLSLLGLVLRQAECGLEMLRHGHIVELSRPTYQIWSPLSRNLGKWGFIGDPWRWNEDSLRHEVWTPFIVCGGEWASTILPVQHFGP